LPKSKSKKIVRRKVNAMRDDPFLIQLAKLREIVAIREAADKSVWRKRSDEAQEKALQEVVLPALEASWEAFDDTLATKPKTIEGFATRLEFLGEGNVFLLWGHRG